MWRRLLKIVLYGSVLFCIACGYQYETIRCVRIVTVPYNTSHDVVTVQVNFTAYLAYIQNISTIARINNEAVRRLSRGDVDAALSLCGKYISYNEPAVLNNYGVALILKGDFDSGYAYIFKAALLKPDNPYFRKNYLYLHELKK